MNINDQILQVLDTTAIARRIREFRTSLDLTQAEFAARLQIEQATLSKLERAGSIPSTPVLAALRRFLGVSIDEILFGPEATRNPLPRPDLQTVQVEGKFKTGPIGRPAETVILPSVADPLPADPDAPAPKPETYKISTNMLRGLLPTGHDPQAPLAALRVHGQGLSPEYSEGDLVIFEQLRDPAQLAWRDHVIIRMKDTGDYRLKIFHPGNPPILAPVTMKGLSPIPFTDNLTLQGRVLAQLRTRA